MVPVSIDTCVFIGRNIPLSYKYMFVSLHLELNTQLGYDRSKRFVAYLSALLSNENQPILGGVQIE